MGSMQINTDINMRKYLKTLDMVAGMLDSPTSYNMERPYVGSALSTKSAWPHVLQQNLSKTIGKRDDFTVWPDKAVRRKAI